jgi:hypothetical protein
MRFWRLSRGRPLSMTTGCASCHGIAGFMGCPIQPSVAHEFRITLFRRLMTFRSPPMMTFQSPPGIPSPIQLQTFLVQRRSRFLPLRWPQDRAVESRYHSSSVPAGGPLFSVPFRTTPWIGVPAGVAVRGVPRHLFDPSIA